MSRCRDHSALLRAPRGSEFLAELGKDDWSVAGDWAAAEARLLELGSDALPQASSSRFVFGSLVKDFLTSIVAAAEGKSLPRSGHESATESATKSS